MISESDLAAWEGSDATSAELWEWRARQLIAEVRRLNGATSETIRDAKWHVHSFRGLTEVSTWLNEKHKERGVSLEYFGRWGDGDFILIALAW